MIRGLFFKIVFVYVKTQDVASLHLIFDQITVLSGIVTPFFTTTIPSRMQ